MSNPPPPMLITGREAGETISPRAVSLLDTPVSANQPTMLLWDRVAVTWRWRGQARTVEPEIRPVRSQLNRLGLPTLARLSSALELRAYLLHHRGADIVMVGREALGSSPWLTEHRGRRIWIPTLDDVVALASGLEAPPASAGGPQKIVSLDSEVARSPALLRDERHRLCPGFLAIAPPAGPRLEIVACGPPERSHGIDLVGRALVAHRHVLRSRGVVVRWVAPHGSTIPVEELADLDRAAVRDLISLVAVDDVDDEVQRRFRYAAAVVGATRPGSRLSDDMLLAAYGQGVRVAGVGAEPAAELGIGGGSTFVSLENVAALGDTLADAVALPWTERIPGPIGLRDLIEWCYNDA